jgi:hypothetical protein
MIRLTYIGVIVHELSHYVVNLAVGIKPQGISVKWRDGKGRRNPNGFVQSKPRSFLQALLIIFAPLYIGTWLIFLCLEVVSSSLYHPLIRICAGFFGLSVLFAAKPSSGDFRNISSAFKGDTVYSLYQVLLVTISTFILWGILALSKIYFSLDIFFYLTITGLYFVLKYSFIGIRVFYKKFSSRQFKKVRKIPFKQYIRRRYKPNPLASLQEKYLGE